ncbi:thioesterase domain-containing protein [Denitromonas iodatirespirans]|uniref:Alpha/beta fold hydrolase n=1 Tax=Denitromonas iodatirespirans TaxID=2795389 RepID=A0A944DBY4_DENI1|nr:alpha/beta fold hydrolase [Denitromonas iodatirespirans]MBT0963975.1 alpha/beta fold hydrolase [Denitromonas iodatirespirans]
MLLDPATDALFASDCALDGSTTCEAPSRHASVGAEFDPFYVIDDGSLGSDSRAELAKTLEAGLRRFKVVFVPVALFADCRTVNGMARRIMASVPSSDRRGRYRILGIGDAGFVALELANLQLAGGRQVEFLGLYNTRLASINASSGNRIGAALSQHVIEHSAIRVSLFSRRDEFTAESGRAWTDVLGASRCTVHLLGDDGHKGEAGFASALGASIQSCFDTSEPADADAAESTYSPLMTIQSGVRGRVPYVCIPGAGASVVDFVPLAVALGKEHPVHGLQPRGMDGILLPYPTIEAAVEAYLPHVLGLCAHQKAVHLVGHSFGGWVAFEMANRLTAEGVEVASLTILDSEPPAGFGRLGGEYTRPEALRELVELLEMAAMRSTGLSLSDFEYKTLNDQLAVLHRRMVAIGLMPTRSNPGQLLGTVRTFEAALRTPYQPISAYEGNARMVFVRNVGEIEAATEARVCDAAAEWLKWLPEADCRLGGGNHVTLLKPPHVDGVARWLRDGALLPVVVGRARMRTAFGNLKGCSSAGSNGAEQRSAGAASR